MKLLFRALLHLLPDGLRRTHGDDMVRLYGEALDAARRRGVPAWSYAAVRGLADLVEQALRRRPRRARPTHPEPSMSTLVQDLRFALRSLRKAPGFALVAVLTLGFGIGANTAIFSLVNAVLLRAPAHVDRPERLFSIYTSDFSGPQFGMSSHPDYRDFRDQSSAIRDAVAIMPGIVNVSEPGRTTEIFVAEYVTGNYFDVLGVRPALGRGFTAEEGEYSSGQAVAVLSDALWKRRFGADPDVLGTTLRASGQTITVVGVAPEGFGGSLPLVTPELWLPVSTQALILGEGLFEQRGGRGWMITARLADGATIELAQEQLTAVAARLQRDEPSVWTDVNDEVRRVTAVPDIRLPPQARAPIAGFAALLLAVVGVVLLIACANVANLTLARASQRGREIALRVVLGARRRRIVRQLLAESALVGVAGGVSGATLAALVVRAAETVRPLTGVAITLDLHLDRTVLLFSTLVTVVTVLFVGLLPALRSSRPDLVSPLREGTGEGSGPFRWYEARNLLVVGQVAASLVLLVGAGLFLKSLRAAIRVDPGFQVEGLATLTMDLGPEGYDREGALALFAGLVERLDARPEVEVASVTDALPMTLSAGRRTGVRVVGYEPAPGEDMEFQFHSVSPGFLRTLGMELLTGRDFTDGDVGGAAFVVTVNETFAERFWPGESPLGKRVIWNGRDDAEVVGLVRDARYRTLSDVDRPAFFIPLAQNPATALTLVARSIGEPGPVLELMRSEVASIDETLPITTLQTMDDAVSFTLLPQRAASWLLTLAGGMGLLLAAVGLYGVMSFIVAQRTREVGVRMALGAERRDVVGMVVRRALALAGAGAVLGLGLAFAVTRFVGSLLFGVSPLDLGVFTAMALAALAVASFASWVPARRAAGVDPMIALRHD